MALAVTFRDVWTDGRRLHAIGTIVASGNYVSAGDALDIKAAAGNAKGQRWMANSDPDLVIVTGKAGYMYEYDRVAKKLKVRQEGAAAAPAVELAAAAYPAGVTGDTIDFYAVGKKLV
jgi:hypothetical protein